MPQMLDGNTVAEIQHDRPVRSPYMRQKYGMSGSEKLAEKILASDLKLNRCVEEFTEEAMNETLLEGLLAKFKVALLEADPESWREAADEHFMAVREYLKQCK